MNKNKINSIFVSISSLILLTFLISICSCDLKLTEGQPSEDIPPDSAEVLLFAPSDVLIEQLSANSLKLNWTDNSWNEQGFKIDKKVGTASWLTSYGIVDTNMTLWYDQNAENNILKYRVYAYLGEAKSDYAESEDFQNLIPSPTYLVLTIMDNTKIKLTWEDVCQTEDGYHIDKKIGGLEWVESYSVLDSNVTSYLDEIDQPCGTFSYRVRAFQGENLSGYSDIETININLELTGSIGSGGSFAANDVFISETTNWWLFAADHYAGLTIIDASDPSFNSGLDYASFNLGGLPDRTLSVFVIGVLAYVATHSGLDEHGWLNIIDMSEFMFVYPRELPEDIPIVGMCPIQANPDDTYIPKDIFVEGDFAYIANEYNGLSIYDVSNYSNPFFVGNCSTNGDARHIHVKNDLAYIANGLSGIVVVDVSDRENPVVIETYPTTGLSNEISALGDFIFIADGENGLKIIERSTGDIQYIDTDGFAYSVSVQGQDRFEEDHVYLADKENGLFVIDISDIYEPYILGILEMNTEPVTIHKFFQSSYAFVADNYGVRTVQVAP